MHSQSVWVIPSLLAALFFAACDDDNNNTEEQQGAKCSQSQCNGSILMQCNADGSFSPISCGTAGCNSQLLKCNGASGNKCTKSSCSGTTLLQCDTATGKTTPISCGTAGCNSKSLKCNSGTTSGGFQTVPPDQKNTEGYDCDASKFVENCDGEYRVYCGYYYNRITEEYDDHTTVIAERCSDDNDPEEGMEYKCGLWLENGKNAVTCVEKNHKDACTNKGKEEKVCSVEFDENIKDYVSVRLTRRCELFDDNKLHNTIVDKEYCSNICSETAGCQKTTCVQPADTKKFNDKCVGNVAMFCMDMADDTSQYLATDCALQGKVCHLDSAHEATCEEP